MATASSRAAGTDDIAKLLLRVVLGLLILLHGIAKLKGGPGFVVGVVEKAGLPSAIAYLVYIGEVLAPLLLIIGLYTRLAGLIVAINMLFAFGLVHTGQLFTLAPTGGWALELQGMYLATAVVIALQGAGSLSVGGANGRWN
ncbi:MAG TPA: DoxX family protein [Albitalea sp.]|nr:DoxX family protein [Albitalea sp.]